MSTKQKKYLTHYSDDYRIEFPFIKSSTKGPLFAFCTECGIHISISHGGKSDIIVHVKSKKHAKSVQENASNSKIDKLFAPKDDYRIIRAECHFTAFLIEHNLPLSAADHAGPLFRKIFSDSDIAKKYSSGRTKTTNIMRVMASDAQSLLVSMLQNQPFAIATDGSNNDDKIYPVVVTIFNEENSRIENRLLCAPVLKGESTGKNIGDLLVQNLISRDIPIENCIAFGSDNANVMLGKKKGVASVLNEANNNIIIMGCICHLIDIAAGKGLNSLPVKIDEMLVDIFYYFKKSSKRSERLKHFQEMHENDMKKILKHVQTRWLSLGRCLSRMLEQWNPLYSFFKEDTGNMKRSATEANLDDYTIPKLKKSSLKEDNLSTTNKQIKENKKIVTIFKENADETKKIQKNDKKLVTKKELKKNNGSSQTERIFEFLSSDLSKAFCLFIHSITPVLEKACTQFQSQKPLIHIMRQLIIDLFKELLSKFIKPDVVKKCSSPLNVNYHNLTNQKNDSEIVIGNATIEIVNTLCKEEKEIFFSSVRRYFISVLDYIFHSFPHKNEIVISAEVLNIASITNSEFSKLKFFIDRFPIILPRDLHESKEVLDILHSQFSALQLEDLPINIVEEDRVDIQWSLIGEMKNAFGAKKYEELSKVMLSLLVIPHSNAECERIFSQARKIKTDFRASMSSENLENLLMIKCSKNIKCFEENFTQEFLKKAKSATYVNLNSTS